MSSITQIIQLYVRQRSPQDIDYNETAAIGLFLVSILITYWNLEMNNSYPQPFLIASTEQAIHALFFYGVLLAHNKTSRFVQLMIGMLGVAVLSKLLLIVIGGSTSLQVIRRVIIFWSLFLSVCIVKEALDCSYLRSILISFVSTLVVTFVLLAIFPSLAVEFQRAVEAANQAAQAK